MFCKTALTLVAHTQEQVSRHNALLQARVEVARMLLLEVLVHLVILIVLSEQGWIHLAQDLSSELLLTKGSANASHIFS